MVQLIQANNITLDQLIENFNLERTFDKNFFLEERRDISRLYKMLKQI
ncbi:MAG: hypothetical protein HC903_28670 [Methylacidiphilales bacterium]|nr:hypothetical protein [Candidatus Methylacidiphilales bacterium]